MTMDPDGWTARRIGVLGQSQVREGLRSIIVPDQTYRCAPAGNSPWRRSIEVGPGEEQEDDYCRS